MTSFARKAAIQAVHDIVSSVKKGKMATAESLRIAANACKVVARHLFAEHYFRLNVIHAQLRLGSSFLLSVLRFLDRHTFTPP